MVKNNQDNDLDNSKLTNLDKVTVKRNRILDNELSNKKFIDDELQINTNIRFNQTLQINLKVSVGNDTYNLTKDDKIQIKEIEQPLSLQTRVVTCYRIGVLRALIKTTMVKNKNL